MLGTVRLTGDRRTGVPCVMGVAFLFGELVLLGVNGGVMSKTESCRGERFICTALFGLRGNRYNNNNLIITSLHVLLTNNTYSYSFSSVL